MIPEEKQDDHQPLPLEDKMEISIGQQVSTNVSIHGSVGIQAKVWSEDEGILKLIDKKFAYHRPMKDMMPGGDAATRTYIFEAVAKGKARIIVQKIFRGTLQSERTMDITVN